MLFVKYTGVYKDSLTSIEMIALCVCFALHDLVFKEPTFRHKKRSSNNTYICSKEIMVEPSGIEPLTSCVQGRRSPS